MELLFMFLVGVVPLVLVIFVATYTPVALSLRWIFRKYSIKLPYGVVVLFCVLSVCWFLFVAYFVLQNLVFILKTLTGK